MRLTPSASRWCHLTWSTARHSKFFNIAALARFCERALIEECERIGWRAEAAILPDRIHVLVQIPGRVHRNEVIRTVRTAVTAAIKRTGVTRTPPQVWEGSCWCSVVTNGAAVEGIRRRLRSLTGGSLQGL
jgi:REP element-mobilizing transposase RayT